MRRLPAICWLALLLPACSSEPDAEEDLCEKNPATTSGFPAALASELDSVLEDNLLDSKAPGVAATVVLPGQGVWYGAAGIGNMDEQIPLATGAVFRIGSVTKTFTSAAILQLVAEGKVALSDPVDDYVPDFALGPEVTLEALLQHTAGIFNYTDDPAFLVRASERVAPADVIRFALDHGQVFAPGTGYGYSNTGYFFLGLVLEKVEGKPYREVIRERLLEPAELPAAHLDQYEDGYCPTSMGHVFGGTETSYDFSMSWAWAAGGLAARLDELCQWASYLYQGDALGEAERAKMLTVSPQSAAAGSRYGLGVRITTRAGREVVGHTGSTMGFNGEVFLEQSSGVCVAVQTNDFFGKHEVVSAPIWSALP